MLFLTGFMIVQGLVLAVAAAAWGDHGVELSELAVSLVLGPVLAATTVHLLVQAIWPRRVFDARLRLPWRRLGLGGLGAAVGTVLSAAAVFYLPDGIHDVVATAGCAGLGVLAVMVPLRRPRAGHCVHCEYDLGGTSWDRPCPECGRSDGR